MRHNDEGTRPYHSASHTGMSMASIHDHSNNIRTIGMGEVIAVLNGVEFRTRHNDYGLRMPLNGSSTYHEVEDIPFPDVPPEVLQHTTVADQITEMREWFKAWKKQDHSVREYRKYFKANLCYMEGAWTFSEELEEPYHSDRHSLDASSWFDLHEKIRLTSYSGRKNNHENFAYLPTTIMNMINGTVPQIAQWNYRILCHPLKRDLPLNRFRVVDDLMARMAKNETLEEHERTRAARFTVNPSDTDEWVEGRKEHGLLDELMGEIPGKDNYGAELVDDAFDTPTYPPDSTGTSTAQNVAYYHRQMRVAKEDPERHRGYSDENLFMAMTSHAKIAGIEVNVCKGEHNMACRLHNHKWTYAIPMEIIFTTPLLNWNPYDLEYKGDAESSSGQTVTEDGRRGSAQDPAKAYNGINSKAYYQTPSDFFQSTEEGTTAADTVRSVAGVLDRNGELHRVKASGTRIFLPYIQGIGSLRTRYPIMPVHGEGGAVWKELEALKDIMLEPNRFAHMFREYRRVDTVEGVALQTGAATTDDHHVHSVMLSANQVGKLKLGRSILVDTAETNDHLHQILIEQEEDGRYVMVECDRANYCVEDGHARRMDVVATQGSL